jgi:hypothetical protein
MFKILNILLYQEKLYVFTLPETNVFITQRNNENKFSLSKGDEKE